MFKKQYITGAFLAVISLFSLSYPDIGRHIYKLINVLLL